MKELGTQVAKGAAWMVAAKLIERSIGLVSIVILARLLAPSAFGIIAMAMSIVAMLELLSAFGFDMALIQKQDIGRTQYDTAWTFNIILHSACSLFLLLIAESAAAFYNEPRLDNVIRWLALGVFVYGFSNIGTVAFRKEFQFHKEFKFLVSTKLVGFFVTIPLVVILDSYWGLVCGMIAVKISHCLFSYCFHEYRPRFNLRAAREMFGFSVWLFVSNVLLFLRLRSADFLIGKLTGAHSLGIFSLSFEIANLPTTELIAPINRAVYPGYSKISNRLSMLSAHFLGVISLVTLFALPAGIGINILAELLVSLALGNNWKEATPVIAILAVFGVLTAMQTNGQYVFLALGKPRIYTILSVGYILLLIPLLYWLVSSFGILGGAWAYLISSFIMLPLSYITICKLLSIHFRDLINSIWRPILGSAVMYVFLAQLLIIIPPFLGTWGEILKLLVLIVTGAIVYIVTVYISWRICGRPRGAEYNVLEKLTPRIPVLSRL